MGKRRVYLGLAGFLGAAVGLLPGLAAGDAPTTASFTAVDYAWDANAGTDNQVTIAPGGTVNFSYPTGATHHNADFGTGPAPTSCVQTGGASSGSVPPLPDQPTAAGWSGTCTFDTPGTYTFHCDLHAFMTGTIVVQGPGTPTTAPTTTTAPTPTTTTTSTTTTSTTTTNPAGPPAPRASVSRRQRGRAITGTVLVPAAYAGGRLEVDVLASPRSLGLRGQRPVRVGRLLRRPLGHGRLRFSVAVHVRRHRRLTLTVEVIVRAPQGPTSSSRFRVGVQS